MQRRGPLFRRGTEGKPKGNRIETLYLPLVNEAAYPHGNGRIVDVCCGSIIVATRNNV